MPFRVAIHRRGIEPADHVRAFPQGGFHQLDRSRPDQHPALRKCNDLDREPIRQVCFRLHQPFERPQADVGVDVDKRPGMGGPGGDHPAAHPTGLLAEIDIVLDPVGAFGIDHLLQRRPDLVHIPVAAKERFVHVGVGIDQTQA